MLDQECREDNVGTLPFLCAIDTLYALPPEMGPGSIVLKAPSVLLNASAPGVIPSPGAQCCVWGGRIYTGVGPVSCRAGWPCFMLRGSGLGPLWYHWGSKPQLISCEPNV